MKRIFTVFFVTVWLAAGFVGCSYDDKDLWNKVDDLEDRLKELETTGGQMNTNVSSLQTIVDGLSVGDYITGYAEMADGKGWTISLKSGRTINIYHGAAGAAAPVIGVAADETSGIYYWTLTVNGETDWIWLDAAKTVKIPVSGSTPVMGVDAEGYWTVDYGNGPEVIEGPDGPVQASPEEVNSIFSNVIDNGSYVTLVLSNGQKLNVAKAGLAFIAIAGDPEEYIRYGQSREFSVTMEGVTAIAAVQAPYGWGAYLNYPNNDKLTVVAPAEAGSAQTTGTVTVTVTGTDNLTVVGQFVVTTGSYELKVLTFEDEDYRGTGGGSYWTSRIDTKEYDGPLLYGESYEWYDENNTGLWASFEGPFWGFGEAISNYVETDISKGSYLRQLSVAYRNSATGYGGRNGSKNFCMHFGHGAKDGSAAGLLPSIEFKDAAPRTVDHLWVISTTYVINSLEVGDGYTNPLAPDGYQDIVATGYAADGSTKTATFRIANGIDGATKVWTKWDLSSLGEVTKIEFNVIGSDDEYGQWGYNRPGYFAYDDVAVRF